MIWLNYSDLTLVSYTCNALVQNDPAAVDDKAAFYLDQNVLIRAWRSKMSPNIPSTEYTHIIVPSMLCVALLQVAHDIPGAVHLGIAKKLKLHCNNTFPGCIG